MKLFIIRYRLTNFVRVTKINSLQYLSVLAISSNYTMTDKFLANVEEIQ